MLLSRVADNLYWGARYLERAEDTARIVRSFTELIIDLPTQVAVVVGAAARGRRQPGGVRRAARRRRRDATSSASSSPTRRTPAASSACVAHARENLRTTREVLPREAWQAVNDLYLYVGAQRGRAASTGAAGRGSSAGSSPSASARRRA